MVLEHLTMEVQLLEMRNEIQNKVKKDLDKQQREYFLHQQMRTIQDELGDNPQTQDVRELEDRAKSKNGLKLLKNHLKRIGEIATYESARR